MSTDNTIPVVDISPLYGSDSAEITAVDQAIGQACIDSGAFLASGIPKPVCPDTEQTEKLLAFYNLPIEERQALGTKRINPKSKRAYRGYVATLKNGWAHNEMYDIGPAYNVTVPPLPNADQLVETNAWPEDEPAAGWQHEMEVYYDHMHDFSKRLVSSIIRFMGGTEAVGAARFENSNSTLRLLNYPQQPEGIVVGDERGSTREFGGETLRLMAMEHKDQCCLSLLWQSDSGGLQMQSPAGEWKAVPNIPNAISVHLGMSIESMTNNLFEATPHRVLGKGNARQSIGFFLEPNPMSSVKPFTKEASEPAAAPEDTYAAALLRTFAEREERRIAKEATEKDAAA